MIKAAKATFKGGKRNGKGKETRTGQETRKEADPEQVPKRLVSLSNH